MKAKEWKTVRETTWLCVFTDTLTNTHSFICNSACEGRRGGEGRWAIQYITPKFTFIHKHTHTRTHSLIHIGEWVHSLCLFVPYLISIKTIQLPPLVPPRLQYAICMQNALPECRDECVSVSGGVWVSVLWIDLSLSVCAFDLQFVSLASFFYVRFGHSCNFICPLKGGGGRWGSGIHKSPLLSALNGYSYFCTCWLINSGSCSESGRGRQL